MIKLNHEISNVHSAALLLGAAGLLSRLLGVVRDRLLAAEFGAGRELDIYYAAFQVPDVLANLFLLGSASAAILPIFQEYLMDDREHARRFLSLLVTLFFVGSAAVSAAAFVAAPRLIPWIAPGFSHEEQAVVVLMSRMMLLSPILLGIASIFSAVIQAFQRFFVYAAAAVSYNVGIIAGILFFVPRFGLPGLAAGVGLGALLSMGVQFGSVASLGFRPLIIQSAGRDIWQGVWRTILISFPRVLSISLSQLTVVVLVAIGSTLAAGSVAVFSLAQNLSFVPIGIFGVSYAVAVFPRLSHAAARRSGADFLRELFTGIRSILFWVAPSAVLFLVLRAHIVRVALGAGTFSWEDTRLTGAVLAALAVSMAAGALQTLLIRGYYAMRSTWLPLLVNVLASGFSVALGWGVAAKLAEDSAFTRGVASLFRIADLPHPEVVGLGIGFAAGLIVNVSVLWALLVYLAERQFGVRHERGGKEIATIIFAAALAGGAAYAVRVSFSEALPLITFFRVLLQGFIAGIAGLAVYLGVLLILRNEDVFSLWHGFGRRLFKIGVLPKSWDGEHPNA